MIRDQLSLRKSVATFLLATFCFHTVALPFVQDAPKIIIAIVDFKNTSNDSDLDYLNQTIPESISTSMAKSGRLEIVERSRLEEALNEMQMSEVGIVDESQAAELGRAVGANAILVGSYVAIGGILRINARLIDVQTSRIIKAENVQGRVGSEIFNMMDEMAESMETQLLGQAAPKIVTPPPEPEPTQTTTANRPPAKTPAEPVRRPQPQVMVVRSGVNPMMVLMVLAIVGAAGYFYYISLPAKVTVNVDIQP